jgi:2-oxo-3-hexenedioate decarboxylase/2-keto-4-pentenoate hydratase
MRGAGRNVVQWNTSQPLETRSFSLSNLLLQAAARLRDQRLFLTPITDLPEALRPRDEAAGYALQQTLNHLLVEAGMGELVGHKIGCTTSVMQAFLNIPNPCAGRIFGQTVIHRGGRIPRSGFVKVGIECEIAVELGADLGGDAGHTRESVAEAVRGVMAAIEIVDDRYADYRTLGVPTLIADDFFDSGCVLGKPVRDWRGLDLANLRGRTVINGAEAGQGTGRLVMGHPLEALAWLANSRAKHNLGPIRAGEFVLLGSVVETKWLDAGDEARVEIEGLGELSLAVTA